MTVTYLKKADKTPQTGTDETQAIVSEMPVSYTHLTLPTILRV